MSQKEAGSIRLAGTLAIAGLLSGLALAGIYQATLPRIERNQAEALRKAVFRVLPGTTKIRTLVLKEGKLVPYTGPEGKKPKGEALYQGLDSAGKLVGTAIPAEGPGFADTIYLLYGFNSEKKIIVGMEVLSSRETPGLGDKIGLDPHFLANFKALEVEPPILAVKPGKKTQPNQVDTISGATISSKAVVKILNGSVERWLPTLGTTEPVAQGGGTP